MTLQISAPIASSDPNKRFDRLPKVLLTNVFSHFHFLGTMGETRSENQQQLRALAVTNKAFCDGLQGLWPTQVDHAGSLVRKDMAFLASRNIRTEFPRVQRLFLLDDDLPMYENSHTDITDYLFSPLRVHNIRVLHVPAFQSAIAALALLPNLEELFLQIGYISDLEPEDGDKLFIEALNNCKKTNAPLQVIHLEEPDYGDEGCQTDASLHVLGEKFGPQLTTIIWHVGILGFSSTALLKLAKSCSQLQKLIVNDASPPDVISYNEDHLRYFARECGKTLTEIQYVQEVPVEQQRNLFREHSHARTDVRFLRNLKKLRLVNVIPDNFLLSDIFYNCKNLESLFVNNQEINLAPSSDAKRQTPRS